MSAAADAEFLVILSAEQVSKFCASMPSFNSPRSWHSLRLTDSLIQSEHTHGFFMTIVRTASTSLLSFSATYTLTSHHAAN